LTASQNITAIAAIGFVYNHENLPAIKSRL